MLEFAMSRLFYSRANQETVSLRCGAPKLPDGEKALFGTWKYRLRGCWKVKEALLKSVTAARPVCLAVGRW
ncbi:uncharacterized protein BDW70DRAFT_140014 [Aspergillus foveolatus]|uniref:uncharacterized protein n=1 Tax=Aspergillus foveolatus TaxID=210207 RepID=UPI003CCD9D0E